MARLQSTQKPTTLLTLKKSKQLANEYESTGEIILITEQGIIDGDVRVTVGPDPSNTVPFADGLGTNPLYPIGSMIYFAGDAPPDGFLACDGAVHRVSDYPELAVRLYNLTFGTDAGGQFTGMYPYVEHTDPDTSIYYPASSRRFFRTPNFESYFVRNLNRVGALQNSKGPDYYEINPSHGAERLGFWDSRSDESSSRNKINRTFGQTSVDMFLRHRHQAVDNDVSNTYKSSTTESGYHKHRYYGSPRSSYYVDRDDNVITNDGGNLGDDNDGFGRQLGSDDDNSPKHYYVNFGVWSRDVPGQKNSAASDVSGEHIHFGFLGYGDDLADQNNTTSTKSQYVINEEHQNNSSETRPINYSVLFCIKY